MFCYKRNYAKKNLSKKLFFSGPTEVSGSLWPYVELKNEKSCIQLPFGIHIEKTILRSTVKTAAQSDIGNQSYGPKTYLIMTNRLIIPALLGSRSGVLPFPSRVFAVGEQVSLTLVRFGLYGERSHPSLHLAEKGKRAVPTPQDVYWQ